MGNLFKCYDSKKIIIPRIDLNIAKRTYPNYFYLPSGVKKLKIESITFPSVQTTTVGVKIYSVNDDSTPLASIYKSNAENAAIPCVNLELNKDEEYYIILSNPNEGSGPWHTMATLTNVILEF